MNSKFSTAHPNETRGRYVPAKPRAGLSLIEVVIALALSAILLSSVYSAVRLYFHYSTAGQEEIERNQLVRVLFQKIEQDLRSVVYRPGDSASDTDSTESAETGTEASSSGGAGTGSTATASSTTTSSTTQSVSDPAAAYGGSDSGVFGDAQTIVLHVSLPRREMLNTSEIVGQMVGNRSSDLKTVSYFVAGTGTGGLQAVAASHFATQTSGFQQGSNGLSRMEGDRLALQLADKSGNVSSLLGQTELLAPEVLRIQFRYFDGTIWSNQWDSASYGGLPRAVEVSLEIGIPEQIKGQGRYKRKIQEAPRQYRTVILLPLGKPLLQNSTM